MRYQHFAIIQECHRGLPGLALPQSSVIFTEKSKLFMNFYISVFLIIIFLKEKYYLRKTRFPWQH